MDREALQLVVLVEASDTVESCGARDEDVEGVERHEGAHRVSLPAWHVDDDVRNGEMIEMASKDLFERVSGSASI